VLLGVFWDFEILGDFAVEVTTFFVDGALDSAVFGYH